MLVTLGTGVGAGFVIDGAFMEGAHGAAGEMGHLTIKSSGRLCNCGRMGCLERYVSSGGLVLTFREVESLSHATSICRPASDTDAAEVFRAAREGDPCAREAVLLFADDLGHGLAQAACLLDPSLIVLGGGLSASSDLFIGDVRRAFFDAALVPCKETQIEAARLGNDAGMRGAASCAERAWKRASSNE